MSSLHKQRYSLDFFAEVGRWDRQPMDVHHIWEDDHLTKFYTGFQTWGLFDAFYGSLGQAVDREDTQYWSRPRTWPRGKKRGPHRQMLPRNEFLMTMMRLKLGLLEEDLAFRFCVSQSHVSNVLNTWLCLLHQHIVVKPKWWPSREIVHKLSPEDVMTDFPNLRVIIAATEMRTQRPSDPRAQSAFYSQYKSHHTLKGLVAIAPFGAVVFASDLYPGSTSDQELTEKSGFIDLFEPGDDILADRGFTISAVCQKRNISVNIPRIHHHRKPMSTTPE